MHDIRAIRADPAAFDAALARRGLPPVSADLLANDAMRREILSEQQQEQARANTVSRLVGTAIREGNEERAAELRATIVRASDDTRKRELEKLEAAIKGTLESLPRPGHRAGPARRWDLKVYAKSLAGIGGRGSRH